MPADWVRNALTTQKGKLRFSLGTCWSNEESDIHFFLESLISNDPSFEDQQPENDRDQGRFQAELCVWGPDGKREERRVGWKGDKEKRE